MTQAAEPFEIPKRRFRRQYNGIYFMSVNGRVRSLNIRRFWREENTASSRRGLALNFLDIAVLAGFVFAQPLLGLLSRSPEFLVVHRSGPLDMLVLVFCAFALPACVLLAVEVPAAALSRRALAAVHHVIVSLLVAIAVLQVVKRTLPIIGVAAVAIAAAVGIVCAILYLRARTWRWSVIYLSPALLFIAGQFLFFSPASAILFPGRAPEAVRARAANPVPVVLVVFDEFPLSSLVGKDGLIDEHLYPNFAELSRTATWYRNATTVSEGTLVAIPAILDGLYPDPDHPHLPNAAGHPKTLFTLLGGSYRLNVTENNTRLCPEELCGGSNTPALRRMALLFSDSGVLWLYAVLPADLTGPLPDITQSWEDFGGQSDRPPSVEMWNRFDEMANWSDRQQEFRRFVASIRRSAWPALHFLHILLPHAPWEYLSTGQKCTLPESRIRGLLGVNDHGQDPNLWTGDAWAVVQSYKRHLLQCQFVDTLVGSLIKQLRDEGLYDSTLLIITADHGASFRFGDSRRNVTAANHADIMSIPLFIKYPGQRTGAIDDQNAESIDIMPTVAKVLKVKPTWRPDGLSLIRNGGLERQTKMLVSDTGQIWEFPGSLEYNLYASVKHKLEVFGEGRGDEVLFRVADNYGWVGRQAEASAPIETGMTCNLDADAYYSKVDPSAPVLLTNVTGVLTRAGSTAEPLKLAVAVNGRVSGVTQSYRAGSEERFSVLVPATSLRAGDNEIEVYHIRSATALAKLPRILIENYDWGTQLAFGANGNAVQYFGLGWSSPEQDFTWTDGHSATLCLPLPPPRSTVTLKINLAAFTAKGKLSRQRVNVLVNRNEIAHWVMGAEFEDRTARIPKEYLTDAQTEITFDMPDAAAPAEIGAGADSRTLGIAVTSLRLEQN